jgi:conjugal transfer pilus assembly protein TraE
MQFAVNQNRLKDLRNQRNILAGICLLQFSVICLQGLYLAGRQERIIITPPQLTQGFWVEGNQFSPQYLEEMALHYAHFLLDVTEKNILYQGEVLLRYVTPEAYGAFKARLLADEQNLKKNNLSTRFSASEVVIAADKLTVQLTGELMSYVGDKKISQVQETYRFQFKSRSGRLLIDGFSVIKSPNLPSQEKPL